MTDARLQLEWNIVHLYSRCALFIKVKRAGCCLQTVIEHGLIHKQWRIQGWDPEARRAEKLFLRPVWSPPYLRVWMTDPPPPPLSEGLDPQLTNEQ